MLLFYLTVSVSACIGLKMINMINMIKSIKMIKMINYHPLGPPCRDSGPMVQNVASASTIHCHLCC